MSAPRPDAPPPARYTAIHVLAAITILLGVAMVGTALAGGGGLGSYGVLVGLLFVAAGALRLRLLVMRSRR